jgi:iron complex transport system permease protein
MKVTLDLDALVAQGKLSQQEAERLKGFAAADTGALGANILFALGAIAVAGGIAALLPALETLVALGAVLFAAGLLIGMQRLERMKLFGQIVLVVGALALCTGLGGLYGDQWLVRAGLTLGLAGSAVLARSGLLAGLAVLGFGMTITFDAENWPPNHFLAIAILALSGLVLVLYLISLRLTPAYERLAIIAMRVAIVAVNLAFLIGSIFGDDRLNLSGAAFSIAWALALLAFGAWAVFANRRWVVNSVAVFGAIHFFTQWFMVLGAQPLSIVGGGILLIGFGLALARFNKWAGARPARQGAPS